uniref:Uncharacterized protein n=1 Tax=Panagrolaimus davidi TaxID=227884 RepID=A0A914QM34_9BILA
MSLVEEYFKLYTNKAVIAMIMILLGVAIIIYIIKRINEALDPSAQEENGKIKDDKIDAPIKIQNWSEKDFKKFIDILIILFLTAMDRMTEEFTEPFYLDYKWKPRAAEKEEEAAEEEEQQTTETLEVQEEEEKQQDTAELKSEEDGVVTVEMKHVE